MFGSDRAPIRRVLLLGFSTIFALWLASAYVLGQRVIEADSRVAAITTRFAEGEEVLVAIKERVLLSSVLVRDMALEYHPDGVASYGVQLQSLRQDIDRRLRQYLPYVDSAVEQEHWGRLRAELDEYWTGISPLISGQVRGPMAQTFLRTTVIPKHELVVRVSEDLRTLNQDALREQQAAVTDLHRGVRSRLWWTSGLAVAFGFAVALFATTYIGRLEGWIRNQHAHERRHKRELQRLSAQLEEARESERRSIAHDLHDEIGQSLMTIKLDLGLVDRSGRVTGSAAAALAEARSSTEMAIQTVRDLSQLLHPPMLDDFGLAATLGTYVRAFSRRTGVPTDLVLEGMEARLPASIEVCAYRIVQEALTNVAKHAEATSCRVSLQHRDDSVLVTVEDDGKGIGRKASEDGEGPGVGLVSVRERVSRVAGTFSIESAGRRGTRVKAVLPVAVVPVAEEPSASHGSLAASPAANV